MKLLIFGASEIKLKIYTINKTYEMSHEQVLYHTRG